MVGKGRLGFAMVDLACLRLGVAPQWAAMGGNGRLGLSFLWLTRLGYVMVDLACLRLGVARLWVAMVCLAYLYYGWQWSAWLCYG